MTRRRPKLIDVKVIPWQTESSLYGIACLFDDGVIYRELWGTRHETELAADLRRRDIVSESNLRRA